MRLIRMAMAVTAVVLMAGSAMAGTVDTQFVGTGLGRSVGISHNGGGRQSLFAGQLKHDFSNGTGQCESLDGMYRTFCTELTQYVTSSPKEYNCAELEAVPNASPMGESKAQAIRDIYAWAAGAQLTTNDTSANRDLAAAFQIAIWEIVADFDGTTSSLNVAAGNLVATQSNGNPFGSSIDRWLTDLFAAVGLNANMDGLFAVTHTGHQDQLVLVPLPAPVMLGAAGLLGVAWYRRRSLRA